MGAKRETDPLKPLTCVQTAGDVLIVPECWGHGVLNIQESLAIATEVKDRYRHQAPIKELMHNLPDDNSKRARDGKHNKIHPPKPSPRHISGLEFGKSVKGKGSERLRNLGTG